MDATSDDRKVLLLRGHTPLHTPLDTVSRPSIQGSRTKLPWVHSTFGLASSGAYQSRRVVVLFVFLFCQHTLIGRAVGRPGIEK
jgi:hypothetical protein